MLFTRTLIGAALLASTAIARPVSIPTDALGNINIGNNLDLEPDVNVLSTVISRDVSDVTAEVTKVTSTTGLEGIDSDLSSITKRKVNPDITNESIEGFDSRDVNVLNGLTADPDVNVLSTVIGGGDDSSSSSGSSGSSDSSDGNGINVLNGANVSPDANILSWIDNQGPAPASSTTWATPTPTPTPTWAAWSK